MLPKDRSCPTENMGYTILLSSDTYTTLPNINITAAVITANVLIKNTMPFLQILLYVFITRFP
jgi:hypothetical protein